ncbi:hypothetical protein ARMA_3090 [Ardenticatena maritima]|uniref:DUF1405 domain-containing protein n=1 Tax=Ardenticatena maritima TaxID=872965 RepID=A0A0M9UE44_9CHLR|nr:DUF1405 domain-containing protein [Ardenticatena maritima]KPL86346.1 hypothetical protein SE16_13565 [Ardenticatena maritima]GAP64667.1 hypothetical protein ARMA_3090 [Ardenticatena maritima]
MLPTLLGSVRRLLSDKRIETALIVINVLGFLIGAIYWYGPQMRIVPPYLWPWLVDSPLSVLGFAIALPWIRRRPHDWGAQMAATWAVFSNVKYGLWTVLFWILWWRGPGWFTLESITMTFTHSAMVLMGLSLLLFYRPKPLHVFLAAGWFGLNDYLDYWRGIAPTVPAGVDLRILQWEQVLMTTLLTVGMLWLARSAKPNER